MTHIHISKTSNLESIICVISRVIKSIYSDTLHPLKSEKCDTFSTKRSSSPIKWNSSNVGCFVEWRKPSRGMKNDGTFTGLPMGVFFFYFITHSHLHFVTVNFAVSNDLISTCLDNQALFHRETRAWEKPFSFDDTGNYIHTILNSLHCCSHNSSIIKCRGNDWYVSIEIDIGQL